MKSIAFICTANMCRSPMAHAIFHAEAVRRSLNVMALSAGTYNYEGALVVREVRSICEQHNIPMPKLVATCIANVDVSGATRIFAMEQMHMDYLLDDPRLSPERIHLLGEFDPQQRGAEIEDPMGQDSVAFELCYERLRDCIVHYLETTQDFR
jgi:protein-tyrosine-phosphatase